MYQLVKTVTTELFFPQMSTALSSSLSTLNFSPFFTNLPTRIQGSFFLNHHPLQAITLVSPACQITPSVVIRGLCSGGEHQTGGGRQRGEGGPLGKSDASDTVNPTICIATPGNYSREGGIGSISGGFNRDSIQRVISGNGNIVKFYRNFRIHLLSGYPPSLDVLSAPSITALVFEFALE